jgi:hypothetical protein
MVFARGLWSSETCVTSILDATGLSIPPEFNLNALRADLNECRKQTLAKQIDTATYRKSHKKAAAETIKRAQGLPHC